MHRMVLLAQDTLDIKIEHRIKKKLEDIISKDMYVEIEYTKRTIDFILKNRQRINQCNNKY